MLGARGPMHYELSKGSEEPNSLPASVPKFPYNTSKQILNMWTINTHYSFSTSPIPDMRHFRPWTWHFCKPKLQLKAMGFIHCTLWLKGGEQKKNTKKKNQNISAWTKIIDSFDVVLCLCSLFLNGINCSGHVGMWPQKLRHQVKQHEQECLKSKL